MGVSLCRRECSPKGSPYIAVAIEQFELRAKNGELSQEGRNRRAALCALLTMAWAGKDGEKATVSETRRASLRLEMFSQASSVVACVLALSGCLLSPAACLLSVFGGVPVAVLCALCSRSAEVPICVEG